MNAPDTAMTQVPSAGEPHEQAEQRLAAARLAGDRRQEAAALVDSGFVAIHHGDVRRALPLLNEALMIARQLGDRPLESDVLGNLGLAALSAGQLVPALARAWRRANVFTSPALNSTALPGAIRQNNL